MGKETDNQGRVCNWIPIFSRKSVIKSETTKSPIYNNVRTADAEKAVPQIEP